MVLKILDYAMYRCAHIIVLMLMAIGTLTAKEDKFVIALGQFSETKGMTALEIYYGFPDNMLKYVSVGEKYKAELLIQFSVLNERGNIVNELQWIVDKISDRPIVNHLTNFVGQKVVKLLPGQYKIVIRASDVNNPESITEQSISVLVKSFSSDYVDISSLQICNGISKGYANKYDHSQTGKNQWNITPNPMQEIVGQNPILSSYVEAYNSTSSGSDSVAFTYKILDAGKRLLYSKTILHQSQSNIISHVFTVGLDSVPSGVYFLSVDISSEKDRFSTLASSSQKFYLLNPSQPPRLTGMFSEDELFELSEFATLSDGQLIAEWEKASCIADQNEKELYALLTEVKAKQKFLFRFWTVRDPNKETPENEKLLEFRKAIFHANKKFSNPQVSVGWKTDMGKILIKYGFPTQIDRQNFVSDARPYEIWFYAGTQGGIEFVFVDMRNINNYILVHSTARGEVINENWMDLYVKNISSQKGQ